ncbi:MAG: arginine--tRNA ligase [Saprospiraceae bacterium]
MKIVQQLQALTQSAIAQAYGKEIDSEKIVINPTRSDMEGDFTVVTFALSKLLGDRPDAIAAKIGEALEAGAEDVSGVAVVKGFLNISLAGSFWRKQLDSIKDIENFGYAPKKGIKTAIEFSSPNTNKPLHLGHVRNILLGWSISKLYEAAGHDVVRVQIINDRGIAICKSMVAWQKFAEGATPESTGRKGDLIVGDYYVRFEKEFSAEYAAWQATDAGKSALSEVKVKDGEEPAKNFKNTYFNTISPLGKEAKTMLLQWEAGDEDVRALWNTMNSWVYDGHNATYARMGVTFDKLYYESDTYLLGKEMAQKGLESNAFYKKEDGSVWADLTDAKLDQKIILRADGTSVYITQDLGTAHQRFEDFGMDRMIYITGDEQNYHFQALFATLKKLDEPYADQLDHLGYGMIDLTTGKMKSREGTVVDADALMEQVVSEALANAEERAEITESDAATRAISAEQVGLAAIKYYILRVGPKKRMTFNPKESVELQGATGPYVQYSYVRAFGVSARAEKEGYSAAEAQNYSDLAPAERDLVKHLLTLPEVIEQAAADLDPAQVASYAYALAKGYHRFWHDHSVLSAENEAAKAFRVGLSQIVARSLKTSMDLLGISLPERM